MAAPLSLETGDARPAARQTKCDDAASGLGHSEAWTHLPRRHWEANLLVPTSTA